MSGEPPLGYLEFTNLTYYRFMGLKAENEGLRKAIEEALKVCEQLYNKRIDGFVSYQQYIVDIGAVLEKALEPKEGK